MQVVVNGLPDDSWFYFQFSCWGQSSRIGRTRTFPRTGGSELNFALASCQDYRAGFYGAYYDMAQQDIDCVIHTGDYIYENGSSDSGLRQHNPASGPNDEILTVDDYRNRYALYRLDEGLKAAHARAPWIVTWDDHELDNNYAGEIAEDGAPAVGEAFIARKRAAYQVYSEVMPLRRRNRYIGGINFIDLFRTRSFGDLADIHVLDTRQFRSDQPCGDGFAPGCGEELDPNATMLGDRQEAKLERALKRSRARWNFLAQQTMITRWDLGPLFGAPELVNLDAWDGYVAARQRLADVLATERPGNPVVLTGDIHSHFAANLLQDFSDPGTVVAAEIVGSSISSTFVGDAPTRIAIKQITLGQNPHISFHEGALRGYVLGKVTPSEMTATFKGVLDIANPTSTVIDIARSVVSDGAPGIANTTVFADPDLGVLP